MATPIRCPIHPHARVKRNNRCLACDRDLTPIDPIPAAQRRPTLPTRLPEEQSYNAMPSLMPTPVPPPGQRPVLCSECGGECVVRFAGDGVDIEQSCTTCEGVGTVTEERAAEWSRTARQIWASSR